MTKPARAKIEKYVIHATLTGDTWTWWARPPWGPFVLFRSWSEASSYLIKKHEGRS
jgi:hypothetical protein